MTYAEELKEKLFNKKVNGWFKISEELKQEIFEYNERYMEFLNNSKTEREIVKSAVEMAKANGFKDVNEVENLNVGDKVYYVNKEKSMYLAIIGKEKLEEGLNIIGSHADSPRLDLKPNPLYEDQELAYFKTHYYGGIKKYQWTTIPLSIHGVIIKQNGEKIEVKIGEDDKDPIFTITDLLPHLAKEQENAKLREAIKGEDLNLLIGSMPFEEEISESVKLNILNLLNKKYGIVEDDLSSSELELVPAYKARTQGFDESMVAGYGQDDKVCVYTSLTAMMELNDITKTAVCIIADKEEIGSVGNTGMESHAFDTFITYLLNKTGENRPNLLEKVFINSKMLSADVDACLDPIYANVSDRFNAAYMGYGVGLNKYTGSGGKYEASDANAEYLAEIKRLFNENNIKYQITELGKVDVGGGGTIAYILANKGIDVIDCGIPILCMHSPYEVSSKYDVYSAYKAYKAFWNR
ncbi:MAG TPA: aminopeptidase [Clostridiaceae bacterium]|jgi:aspartyl aminopeptidase|nr:aminopeptidase [Clostridium sp.]MEE0126908.1 aminopeptidase [Clostridia bacterium]HJJ12046.1 aminopeptidase [Clostridiaceae bacterium]